MKAHGSEICMNYLMFGTDYKATFKQGLTGLAGKSLKEDLSVSFTSLSMMPRAAAKPPSSFACSWARMGVFVPTTVTFADTA